MASNENYNNDLNKYDKSNLSENISLLSIFKTIESNEKENQET